MASEVAKGTIYDLGFQQVSELLPVPGGDVCRRKLPDDTAVHYPFRRSRNAEALTIPQQGKALLAFLSSPQAASVITATGLTPVSAPRDTAR